MSVTVEGADVEFMKFPAGEPHVKVTNINDDVTIKWKFESFDELMYVAMIANVVNKKANTTLNLPYVPFARQDRATTPSQPYSLKLFTDFLLTLDIDELQVCDVHSDVFYDLMEYTYFDIVYLSQKMCFIQTVDEEIQKTYDCVVAPDKGAKEKAASIAKYLNCNLVLATKVRDPLTGQLSSPTVDFCGVKPRKLLIPDDIIDGGFTFIQLADVIKQQYPDVVIDLYVTHGIFSRGKEELNKRFNQIFVYNDMSKEKQNGQF